MLGVKDVLNHQPPENNTFFIKVNRNIPELILQSIHERGNPSL